MSFDFDGTLDREFVKAYAKELVERGVEVWIVTSRFNDVQRYKDVFHAEHVDLEKLNDDVFAAADELGIPRSRIVFTDMSEKKWFFAEHPVFACHVDDDWTELNSINSNTPVTGVSCVANSNWPKKCDRLINKAAARFLDK